MRHLTILMIVLALGLLAGCGDGNGTLAGDLSGGTGPITPPAAKSNLMLESANIPILATQGGTVPIMFTIKNDGAADAAVTRVKVFASLNGGAPVQIGDLNAGALASGASANFSLPYSTSSPGDLVIDIEIDPEDEEDEEDESDNSSQHDVTVVPSSSG